MERVPKDKVPPGKGSNGIIAAGIPTGRHSMMDNGIRKVGATMITITNMTKQKKKVIPDARTCSTHRV